jgi:hypothetical protein
VRMMFTEFGAEVRGLVQWASYAMVTRGASDETAAATPCTQPFKGSE